MKAVYVINERVTKTGETKSFWTKIGAAFDNRDGSLTLKLDALPLSGTLQVREDQEPKRPREDAGAQPGGEKDVPF